MLLDRQTHCGRYVLYQSSYFFSASGYFFSRWSETTMPAAPTRQTASEMERRVFGGKAGGNIEQKKERKKGK